MIIKISKGTGNAATSLASFDEALHNAGISNLNLIYLSSVIPPKSILKFEKPHIKKSSHGDKAYVVMSQASTNKKGSKAVAGIGWVQSKKDGRGLFVEITGDSKKQVKEEITKTLTHMIKIRSKNYGEIKMEIEETLHKGKGFVCALVCALYQIETW
ncbi:MAG: pyruvoyl-dependent arginine decarboxylase [Nanoarchaeota archaeon]|nr:pyruvoyl-dependent arginine decarboxylase [Nanoarchaeota archaeon]